MGLLGGRWRLALGFGLDGVVFLLSLLLDMVRQDSVFEMRPFLFSLFFLYLFFSFLAVN